MMWEIERAIRKAPAKKAPGSDGNPSHILYLTCPILLPILHVIYNACLDLGYCLKHFKDSITVVICKLEKDDYTDAKSYRPITLLNTIGKVLDLVIAQRISNISKTHGLLPHMYLSGQKALSTEHTAHLLIERIHAGCDLIANEGIMTILSLDVSGA